MKENKLNGSADLLAQAIRTVFEEATENGRMAMKEDLKEVKDDIHEMTVELKEVKDDMHEMKVELSEKIDTTNQNMQFQFAEQEKKIAGIGKMINAQSSN